MKINKKNAKEFREYYIGAHVEVLLEEKKVINGRSYMIGYTKEYVQAAVETDKNLTNYVVSGEISAFLTDDILLLNFSDK